MKSTRATAMLRVAAIVAAVSWLPGAARAASCDAMSRLDAAPRPEARGGVLEAVAGVPDDAHWESLPAEVRRTLQRAAEARQADFRARWGREALAAKEAVLLQCPTPDMSAALDRLLGLRLVPDRPGFKLAEVGDRGLREALVRVYLADVAGWRATNTFPDHRYPDLDWDGHTAFDSFPQPDAAAYADIRAYAAGAASALRGLPEASLSPAGRVLKDRALYQMRGIAAGAFLMDGMGGRDLELPCQLSGAGDVIVQAYQADKRRPPGFRDDEDVAEEFNAIYLHGTRLAWADTGTLAAGLTYPLCTEGVDGDVDDFVAPQAPKLARAMHLLRGWWVERAKLVATARYTVYTDTDRALLWDAFTAGQHTNNDGAERMSSMTELVRALRGTKVAQYRMLAVRAVAAIFPDDKILRPNERAQVLADIRSSEGIASMRSVVAEALDRAQQATNGPAAAAWKAAFDERVIYIGGLDGNGKLKPDDVARARAMFREVHAWLAKRYARYPTPLATIFAGIRIDVNDDPSPFTFPGGDIRFGLGVSRPLFEHYSQMIHESRHAVSAYAAMHSADPAAVATDEGFALEGSGIAAEDLLRDEFMHDTIHDELTILLYQLEFGLRDARFLATTEATLQRYERSAQSTDTRTTEDAARAVALRYGLTGKLADTLVQRAHAGTQYLQYVYAGERMKRELTRLEHELDPTGHVPVDPFILFECNENTPRPDEAYVERLRACIGKAK
jgi:hypothetical protein